MVKSLFRSKILLIVFVLALFRIGLSELEHSKSRSRGSFFASKSGFFYNWRKNFIRHTETQDPQHEFAAIFLGETKNLSNQTLSLYQQAGLLHLLSASGFNCMIVSLLFVILGVGFLLLFQNRLPLTHYWKIKVYLFPISGFIGAWFFWLWSDKSAPITRAVITVSIFIFCQIFEIQTTLLYILILQYELSLCIFPWLFSNPSFQLTYFCLFGLLVFPNLFSPLMRKIKKNWIKIFCNYFLTNLGACLGAFPITFYFFREISFMSMFTNFFAVPWTSIVVMPLGLFCMFLSFPGLDHLRLIRVLIELTTHLAVWSLQILHTALELSLQILPNLRFILPP